jgi:hypothetical protein
MSLSLTTFHIKLIAITTMVIDHIGFFLLPQYLILRTFGRFSFPLFAWLIANGAIHTNNIKKYLLRLLIFAFISQIPFYYVNKTVDPQFNKLNIFFTLFLGLISIYLTNQTKNQYLKILIILAVSIMAEITKVDYGAAGVLLIVTFYHFFNNLKNTLIYSSLIVFIFYTLPLLFMISYEPNHTVPHFPFVRALQPLSLFSLFFISKYNHKLGPNFRYLFYLFYPLHFIIIYIIKDF